MTVVSPQVVFFCLTSWAGIDFRRLLSVSCLLLHCLSLPVQRRGLVPQLLEGVFHFVQHAYMHQLRVSGNPSLDKAASFHAQIVLDEPVNLLKLIRIQSQKIRNKNFVMMRVAKSI
ncbi:hypothetical protein Patl1_37158 [Pistacia atlantica]|nr:hypothetical protein Patl1_37158 [Pistacia atlantica]